MLSNVGQWLPLVRQWCSWQLVFSGLISLSSSSASGCLWWMGVYRGFFYGDLVWGMKSPSWWISRHLGRVWMMPSLRTSVRVLRLTHCMFARLESRFWVREVRDILSSYCGELFVMGKNTGRKKEKRNWVRRCGSHHFYDACLVFVC